MNSRAADQQIRDAALDVSQSFIVRAPAGSGKTRLLIQRYLALLAGVEEPEEIVAITFTRKAAAEMRERVLTAFAQAADPASKLDEQTRSLARKALARDFERGWQLIRNASRLRIQTIDALNASITRQMPLAARFGAQPESIDDASELYREAARAVLAEVNETSAIANDVAVLMLHLDNNLAVVENLLAGMLRSRDHWLRSLPLMDQRETLEAALARVRAYAIGEIARRFPPEERDETLALVRFAGQNMPEDVANAGVWQAGALANWPQADEASLPTWHTIVELLLTKSGGFRKRKGLNKNCGFPTSINKDEKAVLDGYKSRMGDLLERLDGDAHAPGLVKALDRLRQLPPARYSDAQWEVLGAIVRLLPVATAMLWTVFSAHGQCDFTEIAQSAARALGNDDAPSDLALALDYRIRHLLVDEFQDTSFAQFELLEKLTRGWNAGDGRTLLVVGDPMQSIYRFREAEVGLFLRAMHAGIGDVALLTLKLTVNFRSEPDIVDWVNRTFHALMPDEEDPGNGLVPYATSVAFADRHDEDDRAVVWHPLVMRKPDDDDDENLVSAGVEEALRVVNIIVTTRREKPDAEIALLVRNRAHLAAIVPALKNAGIAFRAVDIDPLHERPVVQDLLSLTRALLHPADRIAWLAVLRAPWCGLTLNDLAVLAGGAKPVEGALRPDMRTVWELLNDDARMSLLGVDGRARATALREVLRPAIEQRRRQPLRDVVENCWLALRGPACMPAEADLDDAMLLFDLLESEARAQTGGTHIVDLERLAARAQKLYAGNRIASGADERPPVQIMTIHKAKGLEFDTVIVPGLNRVPRQDDRKLMIWTELPKRESGERELLLAPIGETGATEETDAIYRYVQQRDHDKQQHEDVRLLYVAATRAGRRLHLLGSAWVKESKGEASVAAPRSGSLLASLWPAVEPVFVQALATLTAASPSTSSRNSVVERGAPKNSMRLAAIQALPSMPPAVPSVSLVAPATPIPNIDFDWAGETARHVGTVVHAFMQRIAEDGLPRWDRQRLAGSGAVIEAELLRLGVAAGELSPATKRVGDALGKTMDDARGRWLLDAHRQARSEWRLSGVSAGGIVNVAIDRMFVDEDGVRWIIDYKTGGHEGGDTSVFLDNEQRRYRAQLETYAALLHAMQPDRATGPIRLGLYFPLLTAWREWDWAPDSKGG